MDKHNKQKKILLMNFLFIITLFFCSSKQLLSMNQKRELTDSEIFEPRSELITNRENNSQRAERKNEKQKKIRTQRKGRPVPISAWY